MNTKTTKITSLLLALVMLLSTFAGFSFTAKAKDYQVAVTKASVLKTGDTFQMGYYPQSKVNDSSLINRLSKISCKMTSYGYIQNADEEKFTYDTVNMTFADIVYNGNMYRKVSINEYRPTYTGSSSSSGSEQEENGYIKGNTYYFKWEPIVWQVLAKENDGVYVMSKRILDSQPFNNVKDIVQWSGCSLRSWLNKDFYESAFSANEKSKICTITHSNESNPRYGIDGGDDTTDNIWMLSFSETINKAYGFSEEVTDNDIARQAKGTDYAKSQGLFVAPNNGNDFYKGYEGNSIWHLRTPGCTVYGESVVGFKGDTSDGSYRFYCFTDEGVRPVFKLSLTSQVSKADSPVNLAVTVTVKKANPLTVKSKAVSIKYRKLRKKRLSINRKKVLVVKNAQGKVTYSKKSGNKKITVNKKTGKITVKKGLKKGTYKLKIKVKAAGNSAYTAKTKTVTVKIKVK